MTTKLVNYNKNKLILKIRSYKEINNLKKLFGVLVFWGFGVWGFWGFGVWGFWGFGVLCVWGSRGDGFGCLLIAGWYFVVVGVV